MLLKFCEDMQKAQALMLKQATGLATPMEVIAEFTLGVEEDTGEDIIYVEGEWLDISMLAEKYKALRDN